jgi:hypothetical protein
MTFESTVAELRYQASEARAMAKGPMPTLMPTGGRIQSVAVGLTVSFVFRRRSQTGLVGPVRFLEMRYPG